ncbi:helix-turn-helix transcriptional regulator [Campylobacter concisus]|jgi:putative DNA-binding protein|uniref:helix-turn-helix transcriptional regulator n=1 Tax=Campylobacter concisus TaxID=199 RepID=UPI000D376A01|nr:helix-turn-helix domain-containing protein [Campylobacter concisus]DAP22284.1 MAG TPA: helix-turn-helix domain protein [Caudoviricetes sp.]DAW75327.1 MAG TPA: helix-turn-helix domain protein [Caudoviricetes sp.]
MKIEKINYMSYKDAAAMLNLSIITIKKWAQKGIIKRYAVTARSVFVDRDEILELIKSRAV